MSLAPATGFTRALNCTAQAVEAELRHILAYDASGDRRVPTACRVGDLVEWKRDGRRGAYRCRVLRFNDQPDGRVKMRVRLLSHDGREVDPDAIWITDRGVLRVIPDREAA